MKRLWFRFGFFVLLVFSAFLGLNTMGYAETRYQLMAPSGGEMLLTAVNQKREADSIVLYTSEYGPSTRTNPYGVEIAATPVRGTPNLYKVSQITSIFTCQNEPSLSRCGNMPIPQNGIVLSATGNKRDMLVQNFTIGTEFHLKPFLIYESTRQIDAENPSPETNPPGAGFPGYRGGNQLIIYNLRYGQATTGTNEFGFEVTVKDGRVVEQEGANSLIPQKEGDFVLSGHGRAKQWLIQNAPIGSRIERRGDTVLSIVDKDTYLYQLDRVVSRIDKFRKNAIPLDLVHRLEHLKLNAYRMTQDEVAKEAMALEKDLTPILWASYPGIPKTTPKAIWHRPSESNLAQIRQSLDLIQKAGFNTLFLETYLHGDPIFPSKTFQVYGIPQKPPFQLTDGGPDLLQVWLNEAHRRGMKVHVWFQTFYAGNLQYDKSMGSILTTYPAWANIQRSAVDKSTLPPSTLEAGGYFLDPANPDVQRFLLALIDEIITRYPVDGFQLDYIRYPSSFPPDRFSYVATTWGYSPTAREQFRNQTGLDPLDITPTQNPDLWAQWNEFKTRQVDRFVQSAHQLIKSKRPQMPLSVAIFPKPEESLVRKHQNWLAWAQQGWVDFVAPMTLTSALETIAIDTQQVRQKTALPVITGIFGPFNGNTPSQVVEQVWTAMTSGAAGIAMFDTAHLTQNMAKALQMGIFNPATKP